MASNEEHESIANRTRSKYDYSQYQANPDSMLQRTLTPVKHESIYKPAHKTQNYESESSHSSIASYTGMTGRPMPNPIVTQKCEKPAGEPNYDGYDTMTMNPRHEYPLDLTTRDDGKQYQRKIVRKKDRQQEESMEEMEEAVNRMQAELNSARERVCRAKQRQELNEEIRPEDSASNVSLKSSSSRTSTSSVQKAKVKEIELAARMENIRRSNEIKQRKRELRRQLEETIMQQDLEAASFKAREELRLVQQRTNEMRMRKDVEDEEERLSCMEMEMAAVTDYEAAKATTYALENPSCSSQVTSIHYRSCMKQIDEMKPICMEQNIDRSVTITTPPQRSTKDYYRNHSQDDYMNSSHCGQDTDTFRPAIVTAPPQRSSDASTCCIDYFRNRMQVGDMNPVRRERDTDRPANVTAPPQRSSTSDMTYSTSRVHVDDMNLAQHERDTCTDRPANVTAPPQRSANSGMNYSSSHVQVGDMKPVRHEQDTDRPANVTAPPKQSSEIYFSDDYRSSIKADNMHQTYFEQSTDASATMKAPSQNGQLKKEDEEDKITSILSKLVNLQCNAALPKPDMDTFDGSDVTAFPAFMKTFKMVVENMTTDYSRRLETLLNYTKGDAKELIKDCILISSPKKAYDRAIELLQFSYGDPALLATSYQRKAKMWPQIRTGDNGGIRKYSIFLTGFLTAKEGMTGLQDLDGHEFLKMLASKLPISVQNQWIRVVGKCRDIEQRNPMLRDFVMFVNQHSRNMNDPRVAGLGYQPKFDTDKKQAQINDRGVKKRTAFATSVQQEPKKEVKDKACTYCGPGTNHTILVCRRFSALKPDDKAKACREKGLCYGCLTPGHTKEQCRKPLRCDECKRKHPTPLHDPNRVKKAEKSENKTQQVTSGCTVGMESPKMTVVPVMVKIAASDRYIATYAFIDNGCGTVFATSELIAKLHARTKKTKLLLRTLNKEDILETRTLQDPLQVGGLDCKTFIDLPTVYEKDIIPVTVQDAPTQEDLVKWKHLSSIEVPDVDGIPESIPKVTMMIGNNVPAVVTPLETQIGSLGQPYAVRTPVGWMIYGLPGKNHSNGGAHGAYFCHCEASDVIRSNEHLEQLFTSYVNKDFEEKIKHEYRPSVEDKKFLEIMETTVQQDPDGHFQTALPFRNKETVPNNRTQAEVYAKGLKRRLHKDNHLKEEYTKFMNGLITKGFAERLPDGEIVSKSGRQWYLPHHGVFNPHKPGKIRVVFNCPAAYQGVSLNKLLYQGPDLTNGLCGVLIRWRKEPVAVLADIQSMFYQVRVAPEDRDMLRYLWWPDGNLDDELKDFHMCVHIFGAVSSPSCANFVLRKLATDCQNMKPKVAETILNSFYVDDMLKSFATEDEAIEVSKDVEQTLQEGGFHLTKWMSNSRKVLSRFPPQDRAEPVKHLDIETDTLPAERALGVEWDAETDQLGFSINMSDKWDVLTRRNLLSIICGVFDPMGIVAPFVMKAKIILQSLCQQKIGWDDHIPQQEANEWNRWTKELPKLKEVKLNRCMKPASFKNPTGIQFHHFADASERGYGVVSYVRYADGSNIHCSFLLAKARVRPLKKITIPRLELTAAVTAVRVDSKLRSDWGTESEEQHIDSHFWTDSETVLRYIGNESSRFHTFVANRVEEIRDASELSQWHYVPTQENPADDCSRGLMMTKLLTCDRWFRGPSFLWKEEDEWPKSDVTKTKSLSAEDTEVRNTSAVNVMAGVVTSEEPQDPINRIIHFCSDWMKLKKMIAWWLRLKQVLLQKSRKQEIKLEPNLTVEELQRAEEAIIKTVQQKAFCKEIAALQKGSKPVKNKKPNEDKETHDANTTQIHSGSPILNLDPVLTDGILRVGGRLSNAPIPEDAKHQVILPRYDHVSDLILHHVHRQCRHQGRNHVLATLRQKYWIMGAGVKVKQLMNRCIICRRQRRKLSQQMMADLPAERVKPDDPPFTYTGVDYFGPFEVKIGRSTVKRYGVLFTCLNSRAVHIEVANSLNTSSCINALRRFVSRRGVVKEIVSDNGSNFVGSNHELHEAFKALDQNAIQMFAATHEINWKFNTPTASHHGGVWERMIRTVRKILETMLNEQHLKVARSDEELYTLLCEVEATMNSRPLTRMSEDPRDCEVLTPNHLLQLRNPSYIPPGVFNDKDVYSRRRWRQIQFLADLYWKRWVAEYLPMLQKRQRWLQPQRNLAVGDVVLIADSQAPRNSWPMGIIESIKVGSKGLVRSATVRTKTTTLDRPISKLCLLLEMES